MFGPHTLHSAKVHGWANSRFAIALVWHTSDLLLEQPSWLQFLGYVRLPILSSSHSAPQADNYSISFSNRRCLSGDLAGVACSRPRHQSCHTSVHFMQRLRSNSANALRPHVETLSNLHARCNLSWDHGHQYSFVILRFSSRNPRWLHTLR